METHETILKIIEEVDPSDTAKLDEIDREVCLLFKTSSERRLIEKGLRGLYAIPKYTRSRDALKEIRPNGHSINIEGCNDNLINGSYACYLYNNLVDFSIDEFQSPSLPTEELAELHAIIQAIAYERNK